MHRLLLRSIIRTESGPEMAMKIDPAEFRSNILHLLNSKLPGMGQVHTIEEPPIFDNWVRFIFDYYNQYHDVPTFKALSEAVAEKTIGQESGEFYVARLREVMDIPLPRTGADFKALVADIEDQWLSDESQRIWQESFQVIKTGRKMGKKEIRGIDDAYTYYNARMAELLRLKNGTSNTGVVDPDWSAIIPKRKTDWPPLTFPHDDMKDIYTIRPAELVIVAAATGQNKSTYLSFMSALWTYSDYNGLYFSLEMPPEDVYRLIYLSLYNNILRGDQPAISDTKLDRDELTDEERARFEECRSLVEGKNGNFGSLRVGYIPQLSASVIRSAAQSYRQKLMDAGRPLDYIIIDYAGLMEYDADMRPTGTTEKLNAVIRELKKLALELKVPIISAFQLNREAMRQTDKSNDDDKPRRPKLYHLSYANECERSADKIMFLHMISEDPGIRRDFELIMAKARREPSNRVFYTSLQLDSKIWDDKKHKEGPTTLSIDTNITDIT